MVVTYNGVREVIHDSNAPGTIIFSMLCVLFVASSIIDGFVFPAFNEGVPSFEFDTMNKCVGNTCPQFGITLALSCLFFGLYYSFSREARIMGFLVVLGSMIWLFIWTVFFNDLDGIFEYIKLFSLFAGAFFVSIARAAGQLKFDKENSVELYEGGAPANFVVWFLQEKLFPITNTLGRDVWSWILWSALAINIAEATLFDFLSGWYFNGIVGVWLILAQPRPRFAPFFCDTAESWQDLLFIEITPPHDMVYFTDFFWVFAYTSWNACFALEDRKEHFFIIITVLFTALLSELPRSFAVDPYLYIQARTYTLYARYIIVGSRDVFEEYADSTYFFNEDVKRYWGIVNLVGILIYTGWRVVVHLRGQDFTGSGKIGPGF